MMVVWSLCLIRRCRDRDEERRGEERESVWIKCIYSPTILIQH